MKENNQPIPRPKMQDGSLCMVCVDGDRVVVQQYEEAMKHSVKEITSSLARGPNSTVSEMHIRN